MIKKGYDVNLLINGDVVAGSKSCTFNLNQQTADAAAKDDPAPVWDNPDFTYYDWSCSNESFIVVGSYEQFMDLLATACGQGQDKYVTIGFAVNNHICYEGKAAITSLEVDAPVNDYVSVSISLEGVAALSSAAPPTITPAAAVRPKLRGKALMVALGQSTEGVLSYHTFCAATSHKLSISAQTSEAYTKDVNDLAICKEITGYSIKLSTDNLIDLHSRQSCVTLADAFPLLMRGETVKLSLGYYPLSIGADVPSSMSWDSGEVVIEGNFLVSSLSANGAGKDNATWSAEFTGKGAPTIGSMSEAS